MKSIVEKLVENAVPENEAEKLVESAKRRLEQGESPVKVLYSLTDSTSINDVLDILPDEK